MNIYPIPALHDNYIWMIYHPLKLQAAIVDPGDAQPVIKHLKQFNLNLSAILITHHHGDHTHGVDELVRHYRCPVYWPQDLEENHTITVNALDIHYKILKIPGHTLDHIAYYGQHNLFCGDTLFAGGCGRVFEGTMEQMYESLMKLAALPDDTTIYCAHEYTVNNLRFAETVEPHNTDIQQRLNHAQALRAATQVTLPSSLELERKTNPFLRCSESTVIKKICEKYQLVNPTSVQVFKYLRQWKDTF
ncbi:MAG: hydroxyacylglutathione hydrolase [Gammaproteobacteria bacterium]